MKPKIDYQVTFINCTNAEFASGLMETEVL